MKKFLEINLALLAKAALWLHRPKIIAITGSVGKSSTKEAVATVLRSKFFTGASSGNLNSQLGLPLAVLGLGHPGGFKKNFSTFLDWMKVLMIGFFRVFNPNYPKVLVLEMGTDRPGDIAYLLDISGPLDVAVITDIGISHLEYFRSPEDLAREKLSILRGLKKNGCAVLNYDNQKIIDGGKVRAEILSYGFSPDVSLRASDLQIIQSGDEYGVNFKVHYSGTVVPFFIPNALGEPAAYAALAAAGVGISFGMNLVEISEALKKFQGPAGRLRMIKGIKDSRIIDDTYNSAPASALAALKTLAETAHGRKLAAIGGMAELGKQTEEGHRAVGKAIIESNVAMVFLVGDNAKIIEDELWKNNYQGGINWFADSEAAAAKLQEEIKAGDTILVKGSQSARMEKVVAKIMNDPSKAAELLVRQSKQWLN